MRRRAGSLLGEEEHGGGELARVGGGVLDGPVSANGWMPASMISSATWMPCSRSSSAAACVIALHAERAGGPEPAAGGGAARRAAGRLDHRRGRPLLEQEGARGREERERGAGRGGGPGVERLRRRAGDRPAAERAAAIAAVGCRGVDDEVDGAVRRAACSSTARTLAWSVTSPCAARAPAAVTPASVSSDRATPVTAQPSATSRSITARPRFRAPKITALLPGRERVVTRPQYP